MRIDTQDRMFLGLAKPPRLATSRVHMLQHLLFKSLSIHGVKDMLYPFVVLFFVFSKFLVKMILTLSFLFFFLHYLLSYWNWDS